MILTLLATNEPPPGTDNWLRIFLYICGSLYLLLSLIEKVMSRFGRKPPLDAELKVLAEAFKELQEGQTEDRKSLYNRINKVGESLQAAIGQMEIKLAKVEQAAEMHTQQLNTQDHKISHILERLPRRG
jgi:hypothetical protein